VEEFLGRQSGLGSACGRECSSSVASQSFPKNTVGEHTSIRMKTEWAIWVSYLDPAVVPPFWGSAAPSPEILLRMPSSFKILSSTKMAY
jgi:hypothetical protein